MRRGPRRLWLGSLLPLVILVTSGNAWKQTCPWWDSAVLVRPQVARAGWRELATMLAPRSAFAQEVLEFQPLPPESISTLEKRERRERRASRRPSTEDRTTSRTQVVLGKSGNMMRIGSDVRVGPDQVVQGDLLTVGGDITVDGHVEGDVVAMGGDVRLGSTARVDGDVACIGGELSEEPGAWVGGQRVTASGIRGLWNSRDRSRWEGFGFDGFRAAGHLVSALVWLLVMMGVAWAFARFAPGRTQAGLETVQSGTAMSLGIGALLWALLVPSIVALCLVVAILCITIIGIPIALAALFGYFMFLGLLWVWGFVVGSTALGQWALSLRGSRVATGAGAAHAGPSAPDPSPSGTPLAGPTVSSPPPSLARKAVVGVLILVGLRLVGQFLKLLFFIPPFPWLGSFLIGVSFVGGALAVTLGAGALLRNEFKSGALGRWWGGRRPVPDAGTVAVAPPPSSPPSSPPPAEA